MIGGGIAGLASAALLAREGFAVTLLEARDELGGRAGSWERDGFRFDTGPSWYLMPEVFDHFYRLLGTTSAEQLDLIRLDPAYRVFFESHPDPLDLRADVETNLAAFERIEPGAGAALDRYLASAREAYRTALDNFLYSTLHLDEAVPRPGCRRPGGPSRPPDVRAARPLHPAVRHRPAPPAGARLPGGLPRIVAVHGAEPVPPDEPPRPRGRGAVSARRSARGDHLDRAPRACSKVSRC